MKKKQNIKKLVASTLALSVMVGGVQAGYAFSNPAVTTKDLGPFALSVKKFTSKPALNKHHEHLLQEANNKQSSIVKRYTYAMLLGINEPTPLTRQMAIDALAKLDKDSKLSAQDRQTVNYIRNMMIYKQNQIAHRR